MNFYPLNLMKSIGDIPLFATTLKDFSNKTGIIFEEDAIVIPGKHDFTINKYWDLVYSVSNLIELFIESERPDNSFIPENIIITGSREDIFISEDVKVRGSTHINTDSGPVIIDSGAELNNFNVIEGPAYIGKLTHLDNATVRGPVITGKVCRLSGEIEESFIMDYVNKHHYGFLGHAIIENWVNLGAGTSNSDLKNNYSNVRVFDGSKFTDTGYMKLGCIIGEHSKTAIGTMINTGTVIGPFCNVFGSMLRVKHLPPFSWGTGEYSFQLDKLLSLIETVMSRRDAKPSSEYIDRITALYKRSVQD